MIISPDTARLIDFATAAFGAQELARVPGPDCRIGHAEFRVGDSAEALRYVEASLDAAMRGYRT